MVACHPSSLSDCRRALCRAKRPSACPSQTGDRQSPAVAVALGFCPHAWPHSCSDANAPACEHGGWLCQGAITLVAVFLATSWAKPCLERRHTSRDGVCWHLAAAEAAGVRAAARAARLALATVSRGALAGCALAGSRRSMKLCLDGSRGKQPSWHSTFGVCLAGMHTVHWCWCSESRACDVAVEHESMRNKIGFWRSCRPWSGSTVEVTKIQVGVDSIIWTGVRSTC